MESSASSTLSPLPYLALSFEVINIDLKNQPHWYVEKNPLKKVPCIESNGLIVYESLIASEWIDETYGGRKLLPEDPYQKAKQKMLTERLTVVRRDPGWADYMVWPWVERMEAVASLSHGRIEITREDYPKLHQYVFRMQSTPEVKALAISGDLHAQFIEGFVKGSPPFDLLLDDGCR
ncbi:unnamed protein product [Soboliphyme baturini]|uniref:GST N-terminal domain-containing protein n=1 Tax=Soboliphyme baturini TaxID=241478 RepID=A0A183IJ45_9BILA|nr:unnamed protein product [Soboliphyme baturini]